MKNLTSQVKETQKNTIPDRINHRKATATSLHQMSRSVLTGKEDKYLPVNSHLAFETKTNFELDPKEKRDKQSCWKVKMV